MEKLLSVFSGIANGVRSLIGLVLPIFANAADFRTWPGWLRVMAGLGLLIALCVGAFMLQKAFDLSDLLKHIPPTIRPYYLVLLFLLVVAFSWLAYILWRLLAREDDAAEFPDIQSAWGEAMTRLAASGMSIGDAPLFLVLGRPAAGMDALFLAAGVKDIIRAPASSDPPLRVYAWNDAIYVTGSGVSAWSALCGEMTGQGEGRWAGDAAAEAAAKTIGAGGFMGGMDPIARAEMDQLLQASKDRDLSPDEQVRLRQLAEEMNAPSTPNRKMQDMPETVQATYTRRLRYLCKLIRNDRRPWCPINGVVVLLPWDATEDDDRVRIAVKVLHRDLSAAREVLQMRYPTYSVVSDLETARGFAEFRSGFPTEVLKQRIGQRLPLVPDVDDDKIPILIGQAAQWIGLTVLPAWILRFLRLDAGGTGSLHNRNLYLLMSGVFNRGPRLAQVLARGLPPVGGGGPLASVPMYGGCYLAATGSDGKTQAFVPGIFERVLSTENAVSWTPEAEAADARLNKLTLLGYFGIMILAAAAAGGTYMMMKG